MKYKLLRISIVLSLGVLLVLLIVSSTVLAFSGLDKKTVITKTVKHLAVRSVGPVGHIVKINTNPISINSYSSSVSNGRQWLCGIIADTIANMMNHGMVPDSRLVMEYEMNCAH